jgi:cell division protein FtsB
MPPAASATAARRPAVRWDRLGRVALLAVLGGILLLYVGPAHSYWQTWNDARAKRAELHRLQHEHAQLVARRRALREPASLMREARRLGMVRQGERAFVVSKLPPG